MGTQHRGDSHDQVLIVIYIHIYSNVYTNPRNICALDPYLAPRCHIMRFGSHPISIERCNYVFPHSSYNNANGCRRYTIHSLQSSSVLFHTRICKIVVLVSVESIYLLATRNEDIGTERDYYYIVCSTIIKCTLFVDTDRFLGVKDDVWPCWSLYIGRLPQIVACLGKHIRAIIGRILDYIYIYNMCDVYI